MGLVAQLKIESLSRFESQSQISCIVHLVLDLCGFNWCGFHFCKISKHTLYIQFIRIFLICFWPSFVHKIVRMHMIDFIGAFFVSEDFSWPKKHTKQRLGAVHFFYRSKGPFNYHDERQCIARNSH